MLGARVKKVTINGVKIDTLALRISTAESGLLRYEHEQEHSIALRKRKKACR